MSGFQLSYSKNTQGAEFLLLGTSARNSAVGGSFSALDSFSNPAAKYFNENIQASLTHLEWLEDVKQENVGYTQQVKDIGVCGFNLLYLFTDIAGYDINANKIAAFSNYDLCAGFSFSKIVADKIIGGVTLKYIQQSLEKENASSMALDLGAIYRYDDKIDIGLSLLNAGSPMTLVKESYLLPLTLNLGASYKIAETTLGLNIEEQLNEGYMSIGLGGEYWALNFLAVRAGYTIKKENSLGSILGLSAGVGFRFNQYTIDYSFNPYSDFGISHRITFNLEFFRL
jgi:hypothetical protein